MKTRHRPKGISIIELTITLALGAMLAGGTFVWYSTQRSSQFYDGARQIESQLADLRTSSGSNEVPNDSIPTPSPGAALRPIVFATAAQVDNGDPRRLILQYIRADYSTATNRIDNVVTTPYSFREVNLPQGMLFKDAEVLDPPCSADLNALDPSENGASTSAQSIVTFRNEPRVLNHFSTAVSGNYDTDWGGDNPSIGSGGSLPCGVVWRFISEETIGGRPRFRAEIVFNFMNSSVRLVTH